RRVVSVRERFHGLSGRFFGLQTYSQDFPSTFLAFGSVPKSFPACFRSSGTFPRLPRRVFGVRERTYGFPGMFSTFGSIPAASVAARCAAYRVLACSHCSHFCFAKTVKTRTAYFFGIKCSKKHK
ncbi:MAG: hypothetical protein K2I74_10340, partial [Treponemataceae bacterium]|nr:hypothetical protein [Treponemataceae bacterium]